MVINPLMQARHQLQHEFLVSCITRCIIRCTIHLHQGLRIGSIISCIVHLHHHLLISISISCVILKGQIFHIPEEQGIAKLNCGVVLQHALVVGIFEPMRNSRMAPKGKNFGLEKR